MQLEIFCLCKATAINALSQITINDIFDLKVAAGEPVLVDQFWAVASIRFYREDEGQHRLRIFIAEESGKQLGDPHTEVVAISKMPRDSFSFYYVVPFAASFVTFGTYIVSIEIDGKRFGHTPLYVARENI